MTFLGDVTSDVYSSYLDAEEPVPLRVHGEPVNVPVPLLPNVTVPVGVRAVPTSLSVTVAVQDVDWPMKIGSGLCRAGVVVGAGFTVSVVELVLAACSYS